MAAPLIYDRLLESAERQGASFAVLIDPDKQPVASVPELTAVCERAGVDLLLLGGSSVQDIDFEEFVSLLKAATRIPVIGFPGSPGQLSSRLDAVLYLSLVSGRNPDYLIGRHVQAARRIRDLGIESIPTAYMLVDSGSITSVQRVTQTEPIPRDASGLAADTALAAQMMGMKLVYLEGGSGARNPVPVEMVTAVAEACDVPVMVGGGLRSPSEVEARVRAGARFVVIGNAIERRRDEKYLSELAAAAHVR
ncbi:MAG: geranylgeranylglyceryl/heptaprenylglyceryl phosphate synthase [Rhodothermales bacterium]